MSEQAPPSLPSLPLVDTHCHLDVAEFDSDRDAVVERALAVGVRTIVVPAIDPGNFAAVRACCERYPACVPAYGIHPLFIEGRGDGDLAFLRDWLRREMDGPHRPVAVGEIGLDFFVEHYDVGRQEYFLAEQLKLARDFDLPVILHIRRSQDVVLKQLRRIFGKQAGPKSGIAHAFNGSPQQADAYLELGFHLGFGGTLTFPRSTRIRELARTLPLEAIVLETDAPDIPPSFIHGARNEPLQLPRIAAELAVLRGLSPDEIASSTTAAAHAALPGLFRQP